MTEELRVFFQRLLPTVDGLEGIVVADRDGVPVLEVSTGMCPPNVLKPIFLGAFSLCSEQAGKVGFGLLYMLDEEMKDAVSDLTAALNFQ